MWHCRDEGDANNHYNIRPCAPDKLPELPPGQVSGKLILQIAWIARDYLGISTACDASKSRYLPINLTIQGLRISDAQIQKMFNYSIFLSQVHDSYAAFRSQNLSLNVSFEVDAERLKVIWLPRVLTIHIES